MTGNAIAKEIVAAAFPHLYDAWPELAGIRYQPGLAYELSLQGGHAKSPNRKGYFVSLSLGFQGAPLAP